MSVVLNPQAAVQSLGHLHPHACIAASPSCRVRQRYFSVSSIPTFLVCLQQNVLSRWISETSER